MNFLRIFLQNFPPCSISDITCQINGQHLEQSMRITTVSSQLTRSNGVALEKGMTTKMQPSILKYTSVLIFAHNSETALRSRTNFIYRLIMHQLGTFLVFDRSWFSRNQHFSSCNQLVVRANVLSCYASLIIDGQMSVLLSIAKKACKYITRFYPDSCAPNTYL